MLPTLPYGYASLRYLKKKTNKKKNKMHITENTQSALSYGTAIGGAVATQVQDAPMDVETITLYLAGALALVRLIHDGLRLVKYLQKEWFNRNEK